MVLITYAHNGTIPFSKNIKTKRVKVHPIKCPRCKLTLMVKPSDKVCPVCGGSLPKSLKR